MPQVKVEMLVWTVDDEDEHDIRKIVTTAMRTQLNDFQILTPAAAPLGQQRQSRATGRRAVMSVRAGVSRRTRRGSVWLSVPLPWWLAVIISPVLVIWLELLVIWWLVWLEIWIVLRITRELLRALVLLTAYLARKREGRS